MSVFATSHCGLAFPIFRTSTGFSAPALAMRQRVFVRTNKQCVTQTRKVPCSEPRGGNETALQRRRRASKSATSQDGGAQEPHYAKGRTPSQFISCPGGNKGRKTHPRAGRGTSAANGRHHREHAAAK